jgi:tellurite resistance protein TehA-like permease
MGMYTAATLAIAEASGITELVVIPRYWGWLALLIWALTMVGTLRTVAKGIGSVTSRRARAASPR